MTAAEVLKRGIAMGPESRRPFPSLSVKENLLIGWQQRSAAGPWSLNSVDNLLSVLKDRRHSPGTALSGGQRRWWPLCGR